MSNTRAVFITNRIIIDDDGESRIDTRYGSSLYLITPEWVIQCSGNTRGAIPTTFAKKRDIRYYDGNNLLDIPAMGLFPQDEENFEGFITFLILHTDRIPPEAPEAWNAENGVTWDQAGLEVTTADLAVISDGYERVRAFQREVGALDFTITDPLTTDVAGV